MTEEELEAFNREHVLANVFESGWRLFPAQAEAILAYEEHAGLFAPIGVGWGKTLITLAIASLAFKKGIKKVLLCVPSQVFAQLVKRDLSWARRHVTLGVPFFAMGGLSRSRRLLYARSGRRGCYILPYSCLSTTDTTEVLDAISPGLIILDEAHLVKNRRAARTKRLMSLIGKAEPEIVALSGTITNKSIRDYHHLIRSALGMNSPLPQSAQLAGEWASVLDADAQIVSSAQTGPIEPLVQWARRGFPDVEFPFGVAGFRKAYKVRLTSAPGVVATGDSEIGVSLTLSQQQIPSMEKVEGWDRLQELIDKVVNDWKTPNDDEIEHAIHTFKWLYELSAGFYNKLFWPEPGVLAKRMKIDDGKAADILEAAKDHHKALQDYHKELRTWLRYNNRAGMDTPMLVGADMAQHGAKHVGHKLYDVWDLAREIGRTACEKFNLKELPVRDSEAVRVCSYKIDHAAAWAEEYAGKGGIIWVYHQEIGRWLFDTLKDSIYRHLVLHCPAGAQHNESIVDPVNKDKVMIASITAHGIGKNLQHFQNQLYLQWPRSAQQAEQSLGRTHRNGQMADELIAHTCNVSDFDSLNFAACLNDALYIHQTMGTRQKLIYAGYDPLPKIFPPEVLKERGFQNKILSAEQRELMKEKFGA